MTKVELAECLAVIQDLFEIRPDLRIDFTSLGGTLHSGRVMNAFKRYEIEPTVETVSALFEQIEKTPATGAKLVDALIVEIQAAHEGKIEDAPARETFAGCGRCHDGVVSLEFPDGIRSVYCDCGRGQFFWSANGSKSVCLINRPDLKAKANAQRREELARAGSSLIRMGVDPGADVETQRKQYRNWILSLRGKIRKPNVRVHPDAQALAIFSNGDERNEDWSESR